MQRPVMNPTFYDDGPRPKRSRFARFSWVVRLLRVAVRVLLTDPLARRHAGRIKIEDGTPLRRFIRGLMYRLAFAPILLVLVVAALVFAGTHPPQVVAQMDPVSQGVYYDPVTFLSDDGTQLEAWLVPVIDARRVIEQRESALTKKHPAVVLVHDYGSSRQQVLPLVRPLHDAGFVVLALRLRGGGTAFSRGQTFGLNESLDVAAAVRMLRRRPFIDPARIGVFGIGTGASAAILAAQQDAAIAAVVLDNPVHQADQVIADHILPQQQWLHWMRPLCKWAFEITYKVDIDDLNFSRFSNTLNSRPVLMLDADASSAGWFHPHTISQIETFLSRHLVKQQDVAHARR